MTTYRELTTDKMIDQICRTYGLEAKETISFCRLASKTTNWTLIKSKYNKLMKNISTDWA